VAEAALVWIRPFREVTHQDAPRTGIWEEPAPARTFWVAPVGNTWVVVSERPGLFVGQGPRLLEVLLTRYHHRMTELPPATGQDSDALKECRGMAEENNLAEGLGAQGSGLVVRDLGTGVRTPLLPAAESLEALEYPSESMRFAEPLGGLGPYLFLRVHGYNQPCGMRAFDVDEFEIFDLAQGVLVTTKFSASDGKGTWKKYFDLPVRRKELEPMIRKQLEEYDGGIEYDATNLYVTHFFPVFGPALAGVGFQVAYRYWAGCRACPSFEGFALAEELPPEMQDHASMHPAMAVVRARVPKSWRIGGVSVLIAAPAEVTRLRAVFDALRTK
jgi:hypothetical protein